jgi:hypothetical protein
VAAPRPANHGLIASLAILGVLVALGCLAISVFGFWFWQSKSTVSSQFPVSTPQIAIAPLSVVPTNVAGSTTAPPTQASSVATRIQPASTLLPTEVPKPSQIPVTVPSACWFTADDFKSLTSMPTDFEQSEGSGDWWDLESGNITWYGSSTTFSHKGGYVYVSCWHYAEKLSEINWQVPVGYTRIDVPTIGDRSLAYQKQNYQRVRFTKGNSQVTVSFSDTASYVTNENSVKLANIIAGRMPSTVSIKQPPALPRMVDEGNFAKYFGKFELGREDNNSQFIPTTTLASDEFMRVSVETKNPQQRYSLWISDAKQNVYSVQYGILGTRIFTPDEPLNAGVYTAHLEIAGVIYARKIFTLKESGASTSSAPPATTSSTQPQIISLEFPSEIAANGTKYDGLVRFRDGGGDIARISFDPAFIQPQGFNYGSFGFEFTNPAMRWVEGTAQSTSGAFRFSNSCTGDTLMVTYTATLYDSAGNKSAPYPFSFLCKGNSLVVFFTIQNGSPTGYVIDKQGVKHTPPGYLTISDFHVAPGDRIVIQTDQPRFSLLFDCSTTPKIFTPCDFVADNPASLPGWVTKNTNGTAFLNISRADNWAGTRPGFPSQRYPADPILRIGLGD